MSDQPVIEVVAAIIRRGNQILITQRPEGDSFPGQWEFPGGKIEEGEKPRQALKREIKEELGCGVVLGDQLHELRHDYPGKSIRIRFFHAEVEGDPEALHHSEIKWVKAIALKLFPFIEADKPVIEMLTSGEL